MKTQPNIQLTDNNDFHGSRLIQIFFATEIAVLCGTLQRFIVGDVTRGTILIILSVLLTSVYLLAQKGRLELGGKLLSILLTVTLLYIMWIGEGVKDEVVLAFPAVFIVAILSGSISTFIGLFVVVVLNVLALGYVNEAGIFINIPDGTNYVSTSTVILLLFITSFPVWLIASDLKQTLLSLAKENLRVSKSQTEIEKLVHYDALTGLANRTLSKIHFDYAMKHALRENKMICVMFIDLDDFKHINDTLGHDIGDKYLKALACKLKKLVRKSDTICRLGGDEFLLLLPGLAKRTEAKAIARKVLRQINELITIVDHDITSTCSIGLTFAPDDGITFDMLCQKADMAMYHSKAKGKNDYRIYTDELKASQIDSMQLIADMRLAIKEKQLELYYQPQFEIENNKLVGAEALLRWHHPQRGIVSPVEFIPLAERSGLIIEIGNWVISEACQQLAQWRDVGMEDLKIAINASPLQFSRGNIVQRLDKALADNNLPGHSIEIEFTESLLMENSSSIIRQLKSIKNRGVYLSIDDFGTGYSSLGYLQNFDIESLKIDRSFVSMMHQEPKNFTIVKAIIQMANGLNISTVAEGVEEPQTLPILAELGCKLGQGYLWSKPIPAIEFENFYNLYQQK
ncbi:bifunctional diguanylate cyclase/phosphodiesterase [Alteromonadaceae bacterium BrNp21-10]|nr:bifunctional diguanylate cyclase/phosphodiesterase [Alteromonadaceae bacterium BrNp21-10]